MSTSDTDSLTRQVQLKSLEIVKYFDAFCREHDLTYFLCGGALIGAIRHQGFIPWDDDIDVFMKRADYELLSALWASHADTAKYSLCRTDEHEFCDTMLTQIADNDTAFIKSNLAMRDINHGIKLEIIPLDAAAEGFIPRRLQIVRALLFCLFNRQFAPENKGKLAHFGGALLLKVFRSPKVRTKLWKYFERKMAKPITHETKGLTELTVTYKYLKNVYPSEIFSRTVPVAFEDTQLCAPVGYDDYLHIAFGDYMKLPPESERIPKHDTVYIDTEHSYRRYRGIYYLNETEEVQNG